MADRVEKASRARELDARRGSEATVYPSSSSCGASVRSDLDPFSPPQVSDNYEADAYAGAVEADNDLDIFLKTYQDTTPPTSPLSPSSSPAKTDNGTASFDFAAINHRVSPPAESSHPSPQKDVPSYDFQADYTSPHVKDISGYSSPLVDRSRPTTSSGAAQGETFSDSVFDWGAIEPQPSLCQDAFSPTGASSSGGSDDFDGCFDNAFGPCSSSGSGSGHKADESAFMGSEGLIDFGSSLQSVYGNGHGIGGNDADLFNADLQVWLAGY